MRTLTFGMLMECAAYILARNPRGMCTEGRTNEVTEVVSLIYLINRELGAKKNGTKNDFSLLSRSVARTGIEPVIPP